MALPTTVFQTFAPDDITDAMLIEAAKLFNDNYGTWGENSGKQGEKCGPL